MPRQKTTIGAKLSAGGWVTRDASLAAWASESAVVTGEIADRSPGGLSIISGVI